jgi:hypothetical protein
MSDKLIYENVLFLNDSHGQINIPKKTTIKIFTEESCLSYNDILKFLDEIRDDVERDKDKNTEVKIKPFYKKGAE